MKTKLAILFLSFLIMLSPNSKLSSQVTIGAGEQPADGALLQLKDKENVEDGTFNAHKGLALPRVTLSDKSELYPMFLADPENPDSGPNTDYETNKATLDKTHIGLIVYNLTEDNDKDLCLGLNQWDGMQWNCFQSKMRNAEFDPVDCSGITVKGSFVEEVATTSENYLSINLNVTKAGAFTITATSTNGYNFYLSGVAVSEGPMTVNVPAQGTPDAAKIDALVFSGVELATGCEPKVEVSSGVADYALNCASIVVNGAYKKGTALTTSNTITINVTVSVAGSYSINTPLTNGISFSANGDFTVGTKTVTLAGSGTPTVNSDFPVTINANTSHGNSTCSATVPVTLPAMTYAIIGQSDYSWRSSQRMEALSNSNGGLSFGPNGKIKIEEFKNLWMETNVDNAAGYLNNGFGSNKAQPDVILYFAQDASPNGNITTALSNYINHGGCVIYGSADGTSSYVNILLNGVFGLQTAQAQAGGSAGDDNDYPIALLPDDPIINGPFGNLAGKYWGEDNASTGSVILTALPAGSVQICSANNMFGKASVNPGYSIVWYNDSKNFVYFGDSTGSAYNNTDTGGYPSSYSSAGEPLSKLYGPGSSLQYIYNSALELNAVAWAVRKAADSGINPH